jgi:DegV family protein with EDD domain
MSNYILMSDTTADIPADLVEELEIAMIPFSFSIDDVPYAHYPDAREMSYEEFYDRIRKGAMPVTSQVNPKTYTDFFKAYLEQGLDILYICFTTGLSGSYQSACIAAEDLLEKYPERKIKVLDSLCASVGEGVFVYNAAMKKKAGMDIDELEQWVLENRLNTRHWFMVEDLFHLKRGGRVSSVEAVVGSALKIKPILSVDEEGKLVVRSKAIGVNKALEYLIEKTRQEGVNLDQQTLFIGHADCRERAEKVRDMLKEAGLGKDYVISEIGPVIGAHVGPGMLAITCMGKAV